MESHDHLFFNCPFSHAIWVDILAKGNFPHTPMPWVDYIEMMTTSYARKSLRSTILKLCLGVSIYVIWNERNAWFHSSSSRQVDGVVKYIQDLIRYKLFSMRKIVDSKVNRRIQTQWDLLNSIFM